MDTSIGEHFCQSIGESIACGSKEDLPRPPDDICGLTGQIGYTIRLESSVSKDTQLILMTPGILLKKLGKDPMLKEYTHVLIDEVRCHLVYFLLL